MVKGLKKEHYARLMAAVIWGLNEGGEGVGVGGGGQRDKKQGQL